MCRRAGPSALADTCFVGIESYLNRPVIKGLSHIRCAARRCALLRCARKNASCVSTSAAKRSVCVNGPLVY